MAQNITIFAFGSAGDTRPMVALGQGLVQRGHAVRMLAAGRFGSMITAAGIEHAELDVDPMDVVNSDEGKEWLASRNPISLVRGFRRIVGPMAERLFPQAVASAKGADAILAPATLFVGAYVAEHLGIPHALLHLQPGEPTRTAANPLFGAGASRGAALNRASYALIEQVSWQPFRSLINDYRTQHLGLPKIGPRGPFRQARQAGVPVFCGFSQAVVPRPADWPGTVHQTGYWFLDETGPDGAPAVDPDLARFVEHGPAPVYVGFGSMVAKDPAAVRRTVVDALRRTQTRAVLLGPHDQPATMIGDSILQVPSAPHTWLFPRCSAVVHHGGAGTTAAGLRAGVPSVICPFFSDQPFWAARVAALGAGPAAMPIRKIEADGLAARIDQAVHDPALRAGAQSVAAQLATEDGVAAASQMIERWLGASL